MVLYIEEDRVESISLETLFEDFQELTSRSKEVLQKPIHKVSKDDNFLYVGQREMAVCSSDDNIDILGSEDATTCHIVIFRDMSKESSVTGIAHIDSEDPSQFLALENALLAKSGSGRKFEVSLMGGYNDEKESSILISEFLLDSMINSQVVYQLKIACIGKINTMVRDGVHWPLTYGAAVDISTGHVTCATFEYHGPDPDIRSLWCEEGLHNIYDSASGQIVIFPFQYSTWRYPDRWLEQPDEIILKYCSTSPLVEPPTFCDSMRAMFRRMLSDPDPMKTLFMNGKSRRYQKDPSSGDWTLIND